jgi:biotin operon repressor
MNYLEYTQRLEYLMELLKNGQVDSPRHLAMSFECSEKTIRNMINILRLKGNDISYSKQKKKYLLNN